jgi:hypothetical protein
MTVVKLARPIAIRPSLFDHIVGGEEQRSARAASGKHAQLQPARRTTQLVRLENAATPPDRWGPMPTIEWRSPDPRGAQAVPP